MDVFSVITLFGGLAFFLYGMNVMSQGLEKMAGGKLESILRKITSNRFKALLLGVGITAVIQSSSAVTVMLVGLVNSGIMEFAHTIGVIMGANIGTTVTAWLLSLIGVEGDNIFIKLLKPENFSLVFSVVGIILIMMSKSNKKKDAGSIMIGFAVLMFGMKLMSGAVEPLKDMPEFTGILTAFENPFFGIIAGAVLTGIIQSSSASVGILQALSLTGSIKYSVAIPIIMGQNIGTCVTALISSIGVNKNARKVAVVHVSFNLIGTALVLALFYSASTVLNFDFMNLPIGPAGIAIVHSIFNIFTTVVLIWFTKQLESIANKIIKTEKTEKETVFIDKRIFSTPSVAIAECKKLTCEMADIARVAVKNTFDIVKNYSESEKELVLEKEGYLDMYEDRLGNYLIEISGKGLSDADNKEKFKMLYTIGDFERLGDHAVNLLGVAKEIDDKKIKFPEVIQSDLDNISDALCEILDITVESYQTTDIMLASKVEPLEQVIDGLVAKVKSKHIIKMEKGDSTIEMGFILSDLLNNYERISDHCSNIAVTVIEITRGGFDTHSYLSNIKNFNNSDFNSNYNQYVAKYNL